MHKRFKHLVLSQELEVATILEETYSVNLVSELMDSASRISTPSAHNNDLLEGCRSLSESTGNSLYSLCQMLTHRLSIEKDRILFYISEDPDCNSFAMSLNGTGGHYAVILNSGLLQCLCADEIAFVVGHELGHAVFGHTRIANVFKYLYPERATFPPFHGQLFDFWHIVSELTADRMGLVACGTIDHAFAALLKAYSELPGHQTPNTSIDILRFAESVLRDTSNKHVIPKSSHPDIGLRIKALHMFHSESNGPVKDPSDNERLGPAMEKLLSLYQRTPSSEEEKHEMLFLAAAGMLIAAADGSMTPGEYDTLLDVLCNYTQWPSDLLKSLAPRTLHHQLKVSGLKVFHCGKPAIERVVRRMMRMVLHSRAVRQAELTTLINIASEHLKLSGTEASEIVLDELRRLKNMPAIPSRQS